MISVTADTNIYVSALQFGGIPRHLLDLARGGIVRLDISDEIMRELLRVLQDKFNYSPDVLRETETKLTSVTNRVKPGDVLDVIQSDPADNRILECAVAAKSDYIVTGDTRHVLPLGQYGGIPIVRVAEFIKRVQG